MTVERAAHTATGLADGRVLVTGGIRGGEAALRSAELYDPRTGTFTRTGDMTTARSGHAAALLPDGRVLVIGGWDDKRPLSSTELYDAASGRFETSAELAMARAGVTATVLRDGRILVAGGYEGSRTLRSAELFDPDTGRFTRTGSMRVGRASHTATLLRDGRVLVTGGDTPDRVLRSAELYDPRTGRFTATGSLTVRRHKHAAARLTDGRVLVLGGSDERDWDGRYASAELFRPSTGRFARTGPLSGVRFKLADAVVTLPGGRVIVAGALPLVELYEARLGRFVAVARRTDAGRYLQTATLLRDGTVLIAGGYDRAIRPTARAWRYRP
jgi:hypothetical protein